jgi:hypothetical protein
MPITHTKVSTVADGSTTDHVRPSDWNADHTIAGVVTLSSGTATNTPLAFQPGALNTTSTAGAMEYDGQCFYATPQTSARHVIDSHQVITQTSPYALTAQSTVAQKLFDASANGAVTLAGSASYIFECAFNITALSNVTHTLGFGFGGTATITRQSWHAISKQSAASTAPGTAIIVYSTASNQALTATSTLAQVSSFIRGKIVIAGASGTVIPQVITNASAAAATVGADSYFRIWPIGSAAVKTVGHWS